MNKSERLNQIASPIEILSLDTEAIMDFLSLMLDDIENKDSILFLEGFHMNKS